MRRSIIVLSCLALMSECALAQTVVTPGTFSATEAPGAINLLPGNGGGQKQLWIIGSTQFGAAATIGGFKFRPDTATAAAFAPTTIHNLQITLATTTRVPSNVATNDSFSDYLTGPVTVFNGDATISSGFTGPAGGPRAFDISFPFTTPYSYNPSSGNLVVQFAVNGTDGIPVFVDGVQAASDFGRLFGQYSSSTGLADTFVPVIQFSVPEPATGCLILTSCLILAGRRRNSNGTPERH